MRKIIYIIFNIIITFFSSNKRTNIFLQQNFNKPIVAREKIENRCVYIYIPEEASVSSQLCVNFDRSWSVRSAHYRRGGKKLLDDKTLASRRKRWWRVQSVTRNNEETIVHVQNRKNAFPEWDECRERLVFFVAAMDLVDVGFQDRLDTNNEAAKEMWIADAWHRPQSTSGIIDRLLQIQIVCLPSFLGLSTRTVFERCPSQACFDSIGYITLESFRIYFVIVVLLFFLFLLIFY